MPKAKAKPTRKTNGRVTTTRHAWTAFRNRNSDSSGSSSGSSRKGSPPDYDYQYPAQDGIVSDITTRLAKSNMDDEEGWESLLNLMGNNTPVSPVGLSSPNSSSSPVGSTSVVSYENVQELERSNKSIYHFCTNVCKFPLEMSRLFKKGLKLENCKKIFIGAMKKLLSGFLLLYKVIGTAINYKYTILAIFAILYSIDFTRPFVKYMLEILLGWVYFGMEKTGINNQISIFIEFVKEKTRQLFQLIMIEFVTPGLTEFSTKAINSILSNPAFQSGVADATQSAMEVALTSPSVQHTLGNSVISAINSPSGQFAITGAVTGAIAKEAIPAINQHFQLLNIQLHGISSKISTSLTGIKGQYDKTHLKLIKTLNEMDLRNIDNYEELHKHIEDQSKKMINNNAMFNALGALPQITNAASVALESIMGRNSQGHYMLKNYGGRKTRRREK